MECHTLVCKSCAKSGTAVCKVEAHGSMHNHTITHYGMRISEMGQKGFTKNTKVCKT
jgi:hypothetical protein